MRSLWTGAISFGLVNIPIKLYSGVQHSRLDFDMLDEKDHAKIKFQRINENSGKEVPFDKIVKGYLLDDQYVILDDHDFEEALPEKNKTIELENFVLLEEINPIYFETSYYIAPEKQGLKAYNLLHKALIKSKKAGLARFVLRSAETLCVLHPLENIIVLTKIRFQEEIKSIEGINNIPDKAIPKKEMDVGLALIKQYSAEFDITSYKDSYTKELLKIIKAKAKGKRPVVKKLKPKKATDDSLYDQLMKSLSSTKKQA